MNENAYVRSRPHYALAIHPHIPIINRVQASCVEMSSKDQRILINDALEDCLTTVDDKIRIRPIDALNQAGMDMSTPQAVEESFGVLDELINRLEGLIK